MKKKSFLPELGFIVAIIFTMIGFVLSAYLNSEILGAIGFLLFGVITVIFLLIASGKSSTNGMD